MSWLYSRALVEEYLGDISLDGEQSVPLSGNPIPQAYCAPGKMTDFSRLSRFGMTFKPLTENLGEELLTLYREAFLAKTSQLQETETDLTESEAECGEKWHGLLARFDQDLHLWRTVQCSLLEDLNESLQTLPQWGMTVGGELYLLPTLVQTIDENEFGLWLTPTATNISGRSQEAMEYRIKWRESLGRKTVPPGNLAEQVMMSGEIPCVDMKKPTMWGTPKAQDSRHALRDRGKGNLGEQVSGLHNGGKLNPLWTEWLMGWPIGWTDLKPLEMDKSHCVQQQLGESSSERNAR
jgi:hypothetical protein